MWEMGILIYVLIVFAKVIEVSLATVRMVLITKGEKTIGSIIGFVEVILWIYIANAVLNGIADDPLKAVAYAFGFALGNYFGSALESKLGIGLSEITAIVKEDGSQFVIDNLRDLGYAVTTMPANGKVSKRRVLLMFVKRKKVNEVVSRIKELEVNVVITVSDTKPIYGGHGLLSRK
jgi:uncharacterized protein YebE (UPF0316 family)